MTSEQFRQVVHSIFDQEEWVWVSTPGLVAVSEMAEISYSDGWKISSMGVTGKGATLEEAVSQLHSSRSELEESMADAEQWGDI